MDADYWDKLAKNFSRDVLEISACDTQQVLLKTAKGLGGKNKTAVDFGCGAGATTKSIAPYFKTVIGVDFSSELLAQAQKRRAAPNITYKLANLENLDTEILACDVAFCVNVLISDNAKSRKQITDNIAECLGSGGTAVFVVPSREAALRISQMAYKTNLSEGHSPAKSAQLADADLRNDVKSLSRGLLRIGGTYTKHYLYDELLEALSEHGFKEISIERVFYPWSEALGEVEVPEGTQMPWDWMAVAQFPS